MTNVNLKIFYLGKIDFAESNYWRLADTIFQRWRPDYVSETSKKNTIYFYSIRSVMYSKNIKLNKFYEPHGLSIC